MMQKIILFLTTIFGYIIGNSQDNNLCFVNHTNFSSYNANALRSSNKRGVILTIPIVFHVVYNSGAENIPDAQILAQLDFTRADYRRLNADTINTPAAFSSVAADAEIEFCLATQDPFGNFTTGITRTYTDSLTFVAGPGSGDNMKFTANGGEDAWNTNNYLNIWIVNLSMASAFASNAMAHGMPKDGIVMDYTTISNIHLMSHEIGHYLDLNHIYGMEGSNCEASDGGDFVTDTPDQYTSTFGCPTFPLTDVCSTVSPGIMFMNFMDQTSSSCQNLFTQGQADRMRNTISTTRTSLLSSIGCTPVGIGENEIENNIWIFPNPSNGNFSIISDKVIESIYISNLIGDIIYTTKTLSHEFSAEIDLTDFSNGIYYIQVFTNGKIKSMMVIKE